MIEANNVCLKRANLELLKDFNWVLKDPGIYLLLGKVGSGKTLLSHMFAGRIKPSKGEILIDGHPVYQQWGGSGQQVFLAKAEQDVPFDESILQYVNHDIQVSGGSSKLMQPYWPIIEASLAKDRTALVSSLSHGQRLLLQIALAAAVPNRLTVLDGHLTYLDQKTIATGLKMLEESLQVNDRFILLTAGRIGTDFPYPENAFILRGGLPISLEKLTRGASVDSNMNSFSTSGVIKVFPYGDWNIQRTLVSGQHFSVLSRLENGLRIQLNGSIDQALIELKEKGFAIWRFELENPGN